MTGRAALAGLLVVIILVAGSAAWLTVGPGSAPPSGGCAPAPATTPGAPPNLTDPPLVAWSASELPDDLDDEREQTMQDVAAFDGGFVAVGRTGSSDITAFILHSTDGRRWEQAPGNPARFGGVELRSLVVVGDRVFAIGSASTDDRGGTRVAVWASEDGLTWVEAVGPLDDAYAAALAGTQDRVLMLGADAAANRAMAWSSVDGMTWAELPVSLPVTASAARFASLAATDDGWLAIGSISTDPDAPADPVLWRSSDGVQWTCQLLHDGGFSRAHPSALYGSGDRWLVVGIAGHTCGFGASCVGYPIAWASPDGIGWSDAIVDVEPIRLLGGNAYDGAANGFVGVHGGTWWSPDGETWTRVSDGETSGAIGGGVEAIAAKDDGRLVQVGTAYDGSSNGSPWIAVGELRFGAE